MILYANKPQVEVQMSSIIFEFTKIVLPSESLPRCGNLFPFQFELILQSTTTETKVPIKFGLRLDQTGD